MANWQDNFTQYTTGFAFNLMLSRDHCSLIAALDATSGEYEAHRDWVGASGRNTFITTYRALERRGLAEHNPAALAGHVPGVKLKWIFRLTPAGKHVLELLRLSGVARCADAPAPQQGAA